MILQGVHTVANPASLIGTVNDSYMELVCNAGPVKGPGTDKQICRAKSHGPLQMLIMDLLFIGYLFFAIFCLKFISS